MKKKMTTTMKITFRQTMMTTTTKTTTTKTTTTKKVRVHASFFYYFYFFIYLNLLTFFYFIFLDVDTTAVPGHEDYVPDESHPQKWDSKCNCGKQIGLSRRVSNDGTGWCRDCDEELGIVGSETGWEKKARLLKEKRIEDEKKQLKHDENKYFLKRNGKKMTLGKSRIERKKAMALANDANTSKSDLSNTVSIFLLFKIH
tara:strand:+ start:282 stop:881 length:600 start_codon:yes stop_codon:yes gene_type:complete